MASAMISSTILHVVYEGGHSVQRESIIDILKECTRFRLLTDSDNDNDEIIQRVEFENVHKARKAYALVKDLPVQGSSTPCTITLVETSGSNKGDVLQVPAGGKLIHVSELPPDHTAAQVYDTFERFGPIHTCVFIQPSVCKIIYYNTNDADKACKEMNYESIGTYQILVRAPSKYDQKDSFKNPRPFTSAMTGGAASHGMRRTVSAQVESSRWASNPSTSASTSNNSKWASATSTGPAPTMVRSVSAPLKIIDPTRIIIQNYPPEWRAHDFLQMFSKFGKVEETAVAFNQATQQSAGLALVRFKERNVAEQAVETTNGKVVQGRTLQVRMWELSGDAETKLVFVRNGDEVANTVGSHKKGGCKTDAISRNKSTSGAVHAQETSFGSSSSSSEACISGITSTTSPDISPQSTKGGSASFTTVLKHRKLLLVALSDLELSELDDYQKTDIADNLVRYLKEEDRKRCCFDEDFLRKKIEEYKSGKYQGGMAAPEEKRYDVNQLLKLYTPSSSKDADPVLNSVATAITSPNHSPTSHKSSSPTHSKSTQAASNDTPLDFNTVIRFSVQGIMKLADSATPPPFLANRREEVKAEVAHFLESIKHLKVSQQKQKIGEKVFKLFKASNEPEPMKNISKRTVTLLDEEDLKSLLHLTEEFPEILVAKARSMQV